MHNANKLHHSENVKHNFNIIIYFLYATSTSLLQLCAPKELPRHQQQKSFIRILLLLEWHQKTSVQLSVTRDSRDSPLSYAKKSDGRWCDGAVLLLREWFYFSIHLDVHFALMKTTEEAKAKVKSKIKVCCCATSFSRSFFCVIFHYQNK